jgi:hypothetical protein
MSLARLATVELQLIMQYCDVGSLLRLARCSSITLSSACSDFPWRFAPSIAALFPSPILLQLRSSRLLRHCHVDLTCKVSDAGRYKVEPLSDDEFASLLSVQKVHSFDAIERFRISMDQWRAMMQHPNFNNITSLSVALLEDVHVNFTSLLTHLQKLNHLHIRHVSGNLPSGCLDALPALPALQSLHLAYWGCDDSHGVASIRECAALKELSIVSVQHAFLAQLFVPDKLQQLHTLCVNYVTIGAHVGSRSASSWREMFQI